MKIREAVSGDVPLILTLIRELAAYEKLLEAVVATEELIGETLFGKTPRAEVLIAELDSAPVGFALYFHNYSTFLGRPGIYLEDLFVRPEARNHGVGRALLVRLAEVAVRRGCARLEWTVLDWNKGAIAFYRKLGASPCEGWTTYRLEGDALARLSGT